MSAFRKDGNIMVYEEYFDINKMIERAFKEKDIAGILEDKIDKELIKEEIINKYPEILNMFSEDITRIEDDNNQLKNLKKDYKIGILTPLLGLLERPLSSIIFIIAFVTIIYAIYLLIFPYFFGSVNTTINLGSLHIDVFILLLILGFLLFLLPIISYLFLKYLEFSNLKRKFKKNIEISIQKAEDNVYINGILPEVKSSINRKLSPSYDTRFTLLLKNVEMKGYFDPKYEIPTESKEKLNRFLNRMSNGSIGIAGPRGSGKSTLISSFCIVWIEKLKNKEVLSVLTSAPVNYDPRDFLLHIFSLVCNEVLRLSKYDAKNYIDFSYNSHNSHKFNFLKGNFFRISVSLPFFLIGLFFLLKSNALISFYKIMLEINNVYLQKFYPLGSLSMGIIFIYLGTGFFYLLNPKNKFYILFKRFKRVEKEEDKIVEEAIKNLQMIIFQKSVSSAWSGEVSFPMGVKGGINSAATLVQNQLTLPEIVKKYRDFIELISTRYKIIIGIDELDKISSNDKAYLFLNEIKGIFNLRDCYYLISVSEDAMINFNKRGMPFRDAFDSSFDDIIYINYLNFESSKELIKRRIIGMSVPFMCLCYLMSGGLARDLIRVCRDLIEYYELDPKNDKLCFLSKYLIKKDLMLKINAIKMDSKDIDFDCNNPSEELIEDIYNLEESLENDSSLWGFCLNILSVSKKSFLNNFNNCENNKEYRSKFIRIQIGVYLYYVLTIMELFDKEIEESDFKKYESSGSFDELIRAHHFLGLYPKMAEKIITSFRNKHGMKNIQLTKNELTDIDVM